MAWPLNFSLFLMLPYSRSHTDVVGIDFSLFMMVLCHRSRNGSAVSLRSSVCLGKSLGIDFSSLARGLLSLRLGFT